MQRFRLMRRRSKMWHVALHPSTPTYRNVMKHYTHLNYEQRYQISALLKIIEDNLNNRPRKVLGFRTSLEVKSSFAGVALFC